MLCVRCFSFAAVSFSLPVILTGLLAGTLAMALKLKSRLAGSASAADDDDDALPPVKLEAQPQLEFLPMRLQATISSLSAVLRN